jgi:hypothetical protein
MIGEFDQQWTAYWDNGIISNNSSDYYDKYDGTDKFNFTRGRAFWIISMNEINIDQTIPTATLNNNDQISIPLHDGWNLITNPFIENVDWRAVQNLNDVDFTLFGYNTSGKFIDSTLVPYQGYHVQNTKGLTELIIPYPGTGLSLTIELETVWKVSLRIKGNVLDENIVHFGIAHEADHDKDHTEYNMPRLFKETKGAWLNRPEWDKVQPRFASDYRPELGDIQIWTIDTNLPRNEEITLQFSGIKNIPGEYSVILFDSKSLSYIDLRSESSYNLLSPVEERQFKFMVGKSDAVEMKLDELLPKEFTLQPNYPNPFNPSTIIPLVIPDNLDVELAIYNILGERIRTLHKGELPAGRHLIEWDGKNSLGKQLSTGIYFARMIAGENVQSLKIILLK